MGKQEFREFIEKLKNEKIHEEHREAKIQAYLERINSLFGFVCSRLQEFVEIGDVEIFVHDDPIHDPVLGRFYGQRLEIRVQGKEAHLLPQAITPQYPLGTVHFCKSSFGFSVFMKFVAIAREPIQYNDEGQLLCYWAKIDDEFGDVRYIDFGEDDFFTFLQEILADQ